MKLSDHIFLVGSSTLEIGGSDDYDCQVYLIDGGDELALVDAGGRLDVSQILENILLDGLDSSRVRHPLFTQAHFDHASGAAEPRSALDDPRIYRHADCARYLREGDVMADDDVVAV